MPRGAEAWLGVLMLMRPLLISGNLLAFISLASLNCVSLGLMVIKVSLFTSFLLVCGGIYYIAIITWSSIAISTSWSLMDARGRTTEFDFFIDNFLAERPLAFWFFDPVLWNYSFLPVDLNSSFSDRTITSLIVESCFFRFGVANFVSFFSETGNSSVFSLSCWIC